MTFARSYPPVKARRPKSRTATYPDLWLRSGGRADRDHELVMRALPIPTEMRQALRANGLTILTPALAKELIQSGKQNAETVAEAVATWSREDNGFLAAYSRADNEVLLVNFTP